MRCGYLLGSHRTAKLWVCRSVMSCHFEWSWRCRMPREFNCSLGFCPIYPVDVSWFWSRFSLLAMAEIYMTYFRLSLLAYFCLARPKILDSILYFKFCQPPIPHWLRLTGFSNFKIAATNRRLSAQKCVEIDSYIIDSLERRRFGTQACRHHWKVGQYMRRGWWKQE